MKLKEVLDRLFELGNPEVSIKKAKNFGIHSENSLGIYQKDLSAIAKEIGKDADLALQLFDSEIYEARLLCSKVFPPNLLTLKLMDDWVATFNNWEICDSFSMGLFAKSPFAVQKINEWSGRKEEFVKRAAFATLAGYCMADKKAGNEVFEGFFPLILRAANDDRLYVKKAVNWALRSIGKRNVDLNESAVHCATQILEMDEKAGNWIAKDAIRELSAEKINILDYPRLHYRNDL